MLDRCIWVRRAIQQLKNELQDIQTEFAGIDGFVGLVDLKKEEIRQEEHRLSLCLQDGLPAEGFLFDGNITDGQRNRLVERHNFAYLSIGACTFLTDNEKDFFMATYWRRISHGVMPSNLSNFWGYVPNPRQPRILTNFTDLFPEGGNEIAQTLIHEMMHVAGFNHRSRRDAPLPDPDIPGDNGPYYSSPPLRAEICIAGTQSITACNPDSTGGFSITKVRNGTSHL